MNKKVIIILSLMTFTVFVNNLAHPVTPKLVQTIGYGASLIGILFAAMSLANFFMSPVWGMLSDQFGRKPFMIIGPIGYGLSQIGFGFITNPVIIVFFRLLAGGFACASFVAGIAYLIDITDSSKRTRVMSIYTALTGFSSTLGYLVGGFLGNENYHYSFIAQSSLSILSAVLIFFLIHEPRHKAKMFKSNHQGRIRFPISVVLFFLFITMLTSFFALGFRTSFNAYMPYVLGLQPEQLGAVMAVTGLIGFIMNVFILPIIKRKYNDYHLLILSVFMMVTTLALAIFFINHFFIISLIILVVFFAFLALYKPLLQSIISKLGTANGSIMGLNNAFNALGMVIGSLYAGFVYDINISLSFYSFSIVGFLAFILLRVKRKKYEEIGD